MNFTNHYFTEEQVDEKLSDVIAGGPGGAIKAVAQKAGQAALNVARGVTGRMKTMVFEPGWLKVLKPVSQKKYLGAVKEYANWKNQKSKLGPKKNFSVADIRNGELGTYTGDDLIQNLTKYDPNLAKVNMDAEIPPRITIYSLNNKGKVIFFDLPVGEDGKKRYYAIGLDNKAERAFALIHGMRFQDYAMEENEEEGNEKDKQKAKEGIENTVKVRISQNKYNELAPKESRSYPKNQLIERTNFLLDLFEDEVLIEKAVKVYKDGDTWKNIDTDKEIEEIGKNKDTGKPIEDYEVYTNRKDDEKDPVGQKEFNKKFGIEEPKGEPNKIGDNRAVKIGTGGEWYFVDDRGNELDKVSDEDFKKGDLVAISKNNPTKEDEASKDSLNTEIERAGGSTKKDGSTEADAPKEEETKEGKLYDEIKDQVEGKPKEVRNSGDSEDGWRYNLKDLGRLFLYKSKRDKKYYLSYNKPAEKLAKELIDKFELTGAPEAPEA